LPDWDDFRKHPNIVQPLQRSRNWALDALTAAATVLGTTVSLAVRALTTEELELALEGAWIAFQIGFQMENIGLEAVVGLAGEFAAEAVLPSLLGILPENIFGLNLIEENAPVFDLISAVEPISVKVFGVLSSAEGKARDKLKGRYLQAVLELIGEEPTFIRKRKLFKASDFIWDSWKNKKIPASAWPKGINSQQALETFLKERGRLRIPHDHVSLARQAYAEYLEEKLGGPRRVTARQAGEIQKIIFARIDTIGVSTQDMEQMLEATKSLPKDFTQHMRPKAQAWRKRVGKLNRRSGRK